MLTSIQEARKFGRWIGVLLIAGLIFPAFDMFGHGLKGAEHEEKNVSVIVDSTDMMPVADNSSNSRHHNKSLNHDCPITTCLAMVLPSVDTTTPSISQQGFSNLIPLPHHSLAAAPPYHPPPASHAV